ncbi:U-box domain-containing protein 28-like [Prosopis cineraria]|uniref:U-box domain-containing protein 28-like n=1 Tax=Prosopis cineraria TaxID=364024 RepID=UPI00240F1F15|nr:U-box domain-containing protein 28-like [Prosopis cineraria]
MAREKLYVAVPSLFRCPISMDVMRSPVSLCTGVTYDRSSIQHWLDAGHDTCPATMQVLSSKDFIPNLTLHRLIQNLKLSPSLSSPSKISPEQVTSLIHEIQQHENDDISVSLSKIAEFVGYSDENRIFLSNFHGFDSTIVRVLGRQGSQVEISEMAIRVLISIMRENGVRERIRALVFDANRDFLSSIISILSNGSSKTSKVESVTVLELLAGDVQSKRSVAETPGLLSVLVHLLREENNTSSKLNDAVSSLLISVSATQSTKTELVRFGIVPILTKSLQNPSSSSTSSNSTTEKSMRLLAILSTCADGRHVITEEPGCLEAVTERLVRESKAATEDAVVVLWGLCCNHRNGNAQGKVVKSNGVTKILLVLQRECEDHVRKMCRDLVKVLRMVSKDELLSSYETKTTHIKPC